jgi:hypothetical protein
MMADMRRTGRFVTAGLLMLAGAGLTVVVLFLRREGLERASWWAAVVGVVVAVAALVVAWLAWRHPTGSADSSDPAATGLSRTATAGSGGIAVSGDRSVGSVSGGTVVTGDSNVIGESNDGQSGSAR